MDAAGDWEGGGVSEKPVLPFQFQGLDAEAIGHLVSARVVEMLEPIVRRLVWDAIGEQFGQPVPEKSKEEKQSQLVDMYLHTMKDGEINWQGHITAVEGETVFVQLFSWMSGDPTNIVTMTKEYVLGPDVRLYSIRETWIERGNKSFERGDRRK